MIQRALANGTSIDRIITSGADPAAHFTPKPLDSWINGLWFESLSLSLATASFAVLADEWYCHYLSPVAGDPQVRCRTRHLRYIGLVDWRVSTLIGLLPLMLHLSLGLFFIGLFLYLLPQQLGIALIIGTISLVTYIVYLVTNMLPLIYPECPYKTPLSSIAYVTAMWIFHRYTLVIKAVVSADASPQTLEGFEIYAAERSRVKYDLQALLWLYARSSTSLIRRLVIQALAGLPGKYNAAAQDILQPHWHEILDEKREC